MDVSGKDVSLSRRAALKLGAAAAGLAASGAATMAIADPAAREVARELAYGDVRLTGGPLKAHYDRMRAHYLALDEDRLLKAYRQRAGLPAPGRDMGGWYDPDGFVPGHTLGQYISGLSRLGASTGDAACGAKAKRLVDGFADAFEHGGAAVAGPNAEKIWPADLLDKHEAGLVDAYRLAGVERAKALLPRVIEAGLPYVSPVSRDRVGKKDPPYDETYVLPETLFDVAVVTGQSRWRDLASHYLLDKEYFDPLSRGEDVLPGRHAYSHAIALSSAGKAWLELGDPKHKAALQNAWRFLELQRYASGGFGPEEQFVTPHQGALFRSLTATSAHFETPCGCYASTKLARYLLRFTGEARYGDGLERDLYNGVLATRAPDTDGDYPYYSTFGPAASKSFYPKKWPCCSGTLVQGVADYVLNLYFQSDDALWVNMFAPSRVSWRAKGVELVQETAYPASDSTRLTLSMSELTAFGLRIRMPGWLTAPGVITVNGAPVRADTRPGGFAEIRRTWRNGDRVEVSLPQAFRVQPIDDQNPDTVALMRGPVMYVGLNTAGGAEAGVLDRASLTRVADADWTGRVGDKTRVFTPFHTVRDETYDTYFPVAKA
jgi:DUF1680 family protein